MHTVRTEQPDAMEPPGTKPPTISDPSDPQAPDPVAPFTARRPIALITAIALAAITALTVVLTQATGNGPPHAATSPAAPKIPISYAVTGSGTAQITYTGNGTSTSTSTSTSTTVTARLPWHHTTELAPGHAPATVSIVLGPAGGRATCALTLHGQPVQHATAYGTYGRATCTTNTTP